MSQLAHNRSRAYEEFIRNKQDNNKKKDDENKLDIIQNKDDVIKQLLLTEEEMINKLNKVRHAKKEIDKHCNE